ncbi:hypothetical protein DUI87_01256 [Hirundo rustica rustica]|uniref:RNA-directed DNA polymerase n=1 Tax=Hirundo rustica rustica TaxID=333673 RepID=A0A3M0L619_HIRRU|nr:hypothetical protein DUI87_01256 [Hirundo rustica rustica]
MAVQDTLPDVFNQAKLSHQFFPQNVPALVQIFKITREQARAIVGSCPSCQNFALPSMGAGVNPRGLESLQLWQTDVTHYATFGRQKYINVSIDTFSGTIFASAHSGEKGKDAIRHLLLAFSTLGIPQAIKTDNGPGYSSKTLKQFLNQWGVKHNTSIPHSSTGQAIVERAQRTLRLTDQLIIPKYPAMSPAAGNSQLLQIGLWMILTFSSANAWIVPQPNQNTWVTLAKALQQDNLCLSTGSVDNLLSTCLTIEKVYSSPSDLKDVPLENPNWELFTDGSSFTKNDKRMTGYAVTMQDKVIEAKALPADVSSQKAELIALTRTLDLSEGKKVNIWTDSKYAFSVVHAHGVIWKERRLLNAQVPNPPEVNLANQVCHLLSVRGQKGTDVVERSCSQGFSSDVGVKSESSGDAVKGSQNGFTFFAGIHLGPFSVETQAKPLPQVAKG